EVVAHGLPPGLGSHVHWDRRIDARLAGALMGIQAIKGVEIGDGFAVAGLRGSQAHDEIEATPEGVRRRTGRAGGTEGGMTTGETLRVRAAMKPISTVPRALDTVDVRSGEPAKAINQRSDVCAVPAAGVVAEAMVALVLALGGGAVLDPATRALLRDRRVVFLDVGVKDAAARVGFNRDRPLLLGNPRAQWLRLMAARRPLYEEVATATVSTDGREPDAV